MAGTEAHSDRHNSVQAVAIKLEISNYVRPPRFYATVLQQKLEPTMSGEHSVS